MTASDYPLLTLGGYETYQLAHIATFIADSLARHRLSRRGLPGRAERAAALRDLSVGRAALDTVRGSPEPTPPHLLPRAIDTATYEAAQQRIGSGPRTADVVAMPSFGPLAWAVVGHVPGIGQVGAVVHSADLAAGLRSHFLTRPIEELASWAVTDRPEKVPALPARVDLARAIGSLDPGVPAHRVVADALRGPDPYVNAAVQRHFQDAAGPLVAPLSEGDSPQRPNHEGRPVGDQLAPIAGPDQQRGQQQEGDDQQQSRRDRVTPAQDEGDGREQLHIAPPQRTVGKQGDEYACDRDAGGSDKGASAAGRAECGDQCRAGAQGSREPVRQAPLTRVHHRGRGPGNRQRQSGRRRPQPLRRQHGRQPGQGRDGDGLGSAGAP